jgi:hypothetical protein
MMQVKGLTVRTDVNDLAEREDHIRKSAQVPFSCSTVDRLVRRI